MPFMRFAKMIGKRRGVTSAMSVPLAKPRGSHAGLIAIVATLSALSATLMLLAPQAAHAFDPLNPFDSFTDSGPVTPEEREQREQMRADLYDRFSPAYRIDAPLVSESSVAAFQQAIERYRQIVATGGWPETADKVTLRPGETGSEIAAIRRHLIMEGDISGGSENNPTFDQEFLEGLAKFQIRNGLRVSGFVDSRTLAALNVTAPERLKQLESNLARIQGLMSINKAPRYVLVNVPAFVAQAVQDGNLALESNVIAGKPARATPQVSAKIIEINFYPTWTVPEIVAQQDLIPKIRKDPSYFSEEHFSVMTDYKSPPLDPATVDITGRMLEMLAAYGYDKNHPAVKKAIAFVQKEQEADGSWFGRWGVNYIYGTMLVLRGLEAIGVDHHEPCIQQAAEWLRMTQNADGGWGETCGSYDDPNVKGQGSSTASQTAWAVMGLLAANDTRSDSVARGIAYILRTQKKDGSWSEDAYTGTGFPRVFYLMYHMYRQYFPLIALTNYAKVMKSSS